MLFIRAWPMHSPILLPHVPTRLGCHHGIKGVACRAQVIPAEDTSSSSGKVRKERQKQERERKKEERLASLRWQPKHIKHKLEIATMASTACLEMGHGRRRRRRLGGAAMAVTASSKTWPCPAALPWCRGRCRSFGNH